MRTVHTQRFYEELLQYLQQQISHVCLIKNKINYINTQIDFSKGFLRIIRQPVFYNIFQNKNEGFNFDVKFAFTKYYKKKFSFLAIFVQ